MAHPLDALTFPLHSTHLIEAGAGTGKTYTIAALYLRLVLGHGGENGFHKPLIPPEILVVTFTNAAKEELRDRIRSRLTESAAFFRGQCEGDDYLKTLREQYHPDQWPGNARLLDQAAQWMDESAIHTIHAWCQRMLRQHAFDSGSLFDLELETDDQELLEEAACDYWRCHFYLKSAAQLTDLMTLANCATPQELLKKVRPLLNVPVTSSSDPFELLGRRRQAIEEARRIWDSDFSAAVEQIQRAQADKTLNGNKYRTASLSKWLDQLICWVKDKGPLPEAHVLEKFSGRGLADGVSKNKSAPQHPAYKAFDNLNKLLAELKIDKALFIHAAQDISRRFRQEKQRRAQVGFDDLLTRLNDALQKPGNERLAEVIRKQFPVVLIDEFQDTDPVQYAIFSKVYLNRPNAGLFMIGDPKQAIYAFRGADVHTYLKARQDTIGSHYTLSKNFRSTDGMVQAVNRMFQAAAQRPEGGFLFKDQIPFEPAAAQGRKEQFVVKGEPAAAMTFWQLQQAGPVNKTGEDGYLDQMAKATAAEIVRLLNLAQQQPPRAGFQEVGRTLSDGVLKALRPVDIAVLVRDGNEARVIRRALNVCRVRSVYLSDKDSVFDGGEAKSLLYLLRACAEPERERILKTALATDILALSLTHLDDLNQDESAWEAEVERFRRYQRIWRQQGVLPMLRALLHEFGVPVRLLAINGGERILTNLLHLSEILQTAATQLDGEQALIRWLAEQLEQQNNISDERILRLESDEELVKVVTIHKSKGLEYPLVFLPFICSFREVTTRNSSVVKYHDEKGELKLIMNPSVEDLAAADKERLAEDLRLLYVALTRARYACWLGIGVMGKKSQKSETGLLHRSALGYLLSGGQMIPTDQLTKKLATLKGDCQHIAIEPLPEVSDKIYQSLMDEIQLAPALTFTGQVPRDWSITSYTGMLAGMNLPESDDPESDELEYRGLEAVFDFPNSAAEDQLQQAETEPVAEPEVMEGFQSIHQFPSGPDPGTFLHELLEWAADESFSELCRDRQCIYEKIDELCRHRDWENWTEMLTDWLQQLLQTPFKLPEEQGRVVLAQLAANDYQAEMEFLFAAHQVDTKTLDDLITNAIMPKAPRPQLRKHTVNGMLKGFMDLVFCRHGRYYVLDYKSNYLGENDQAYGVEAMAGAMLEHRYDLQYVLYTLALHRLLKSRLADYDYQRDVGGAVYLFLRGVHAEGQGAYTDKPPRWLIEQLDDYFAGR
ncbi:MAG: exodeoxyribonuclease V subunit beta [Desulfobacterales bacterium]|nr:exodeoxyribonuclease V subunit beta [Desulfobacterales bacterium]